MKCPRRSEVARLGYTLPYEDTWQADSCSYCGSLHPDIFMSRLKASDVILVPTDKNYKAYLRNDGGEPFLQRYRTDNLPFEGLDSPNHTWVTRSMEETKFYFQHLSEEQHIEFVQLMNAGTIKFAIPGHFYVLPFFIGVREPERL